MLFFHSKSVNVPISLVTKFKSQWMDIYTPLVNILDIQVRMNLSVPCIDFRISDSDDQMKLEKACAFIEAILNGFSTQQAVHLLKNNVIFLNFHISEIKRLGGDNSSRAIGRIIGREGKVKSAIESTFNVCILIKDDIIYIIGNIEAVRQAKESISRLVLGAHPGSILNKLKVIASKQRKGHFETAFLNKEIN